MHAYRMADDEDDSDAEWIANGALLLIIAIVKFILINNTVVWCKVTFKI